MTPETKAALRAEQQATISEILRREARAMELGQHEVANAMNGLRGALVRVWALQEAPRE